MTCPGTKKGKDLTMEDEEDAKGVTSKITRIHVHHAKGRKPPKKKKGVGIFDDETLIEIALQIKEMEKAEAKPRKKWTRRTVAPREQSTIRPKINTICYREKRKNQHKSKEAINGTSGKKKTVDPVQPTVRPLELETPSHLNAKKKLYSILLGPNKRPTSVRLSASEIDRYIAKSKTEKRKTEKSKTGKTKAEKSKSINGQQFSDSSICKVPNTSTNLETHLNIVAPNLHCDCSSQSVVKVSMEFSPEEMDFEFDGLQTLTHLAGSSVLPVHPVSDSQIFLKENQNTASAENTQYCTLLCHPVDEINDAVLANINETVELISTNHEDLPKYIKSSSVSNVPSEESLIMRSQPLDSNAPSCALHVSAASRSTATSPFTFGKYPEPDTLDIFTCDHSRYVSGASKTGCKTTDIEKTAFKKTRGMVDWEYYIKRPTEKEYSHGRKYEKRHNRNKYKLTDVAKSILNYCNTIDPANRVIQEEIKRSNAMILEYFNAQFLEFLRGLANNQMPKKKVTWSLKTIQTDPKLDVAKYVIQRIESNESNDYEHLTNLGELFSDMYEEFPRFVREWQFFGPKLPFQDTALAYTDQPFHSMNIRHDDKSLLINSLNNETFAITLFRTALANHYEEDEFHMGYNNQWILYKDLHSLTPGHDVTKTIMDELSNGFCERGAAAADRPENRFLYISSAVLQIFMNGGQESGIIQDTTDRIVEAVYGQFPRHHVVFGLHLKYIAHYMLIHVNVSTRQISIFDPYQTKKTGIKGLMSKCLKEYDWMKGESGQRLSCDWPANLKFTTDPNVPKQFPSDIYNSGIFVLLHLENLTREFEERNRALYLDANPSAEEARMNPEQKAKKMANRKRDLTKLMKPLNLRMRYFRLLRAVTISDSSMEPVLQKKNLALREEDHADLVYVGTNKG